ncbi:zonular occludens toxin domain-containing protein [Planctomicrobium sp. SH661]|uniref:zonular occludens toxin domain-containing protein n=1 Tax=Planctomicrobium sp. SH661 TaxID=3448124 RepID=UPI003F5B6027
MASRPQLECVIGESGAGKTLYVSAFQLVNFLRDESGDYWHNLPLKPEGLAALSGKSVQEVEARLKLIPAEELKTWIEGKGGPWSFFADKDIKGAHIAIDEAHRYFGKKHSKAHLAALGEWTGGLRHHGATCQLITQHEFKLSTDARNEAGVQTRIFAPSQRTELFTGAKWHDVLQLLSKFWRKKVGLTIVREGVTSGRSARDFTNDGFRYIFHKKEHYACYDSYNNIAAEGASHDGEANRPKEEWERFSWPRLILWYVERNFWPTGLRAGAAAGLFWLFALGGLSMIVEGAFSFGSLAAGSLGGTPTAKGKAQVQSVSPDSEPQPTLAKDVESKRQLNQLAEQNRMMALRLQEAATYAEELTGLVAVVGDACYWADGSSGKVGDRIETGPFIGHQVVSIDSAHGRVELSGGTVLRVGVLSPSQYQRVRSWTAAGTPGSGAQPSGSSGPGEGTHSKSDLSVSSPPIVPIPGVKPRFQDGDRPVQSNPDAGVHNPPRRSIRRLRGGGTSIGPENRDGGLSGNSSPGVSGDGSPDSGRGTGGAPGPVLPGAAETGGQGGHDSQDSQAD